MPKVVGPCEAKVVESRGVGNDRMAAATSPLCYTNGPVVMQHSQTPGASAAWWEWAQCRSARKLINSLGSEICQDRMHSARIGTNERDMMLLMMAGRPRSVGCPMGRKREVESTRPVATGLGVSSEAGVESTEAG